jgi:ACT domain-containing protein
MQISINVSFQFVCMKAIVTVVGMDRPGIVAGISGVLAKMNVNILDITQNYAHEFFTMILIVDFAKTSSSLKEVDLKLQEEGKKLGVFVSIQHEDIFKAMHRI